MRKCLYACMFFEVFSRLRALTEPKVVPYGTVLDNALLRHGLSAVVFPARAWHVNTERSSYIGFTLWPGQ